MNGVIQPSTLDPRMVLQKLSEADGYVVIAYKKARSPRQAAVENFIVGLTPEETLGILAETVNAMLATGQVKL